MAIPFFIHLTNADGHLETAQSLCPFKMLTGFPCPGCGITKSLVSLYDGNLIESLRYHIFGLPTAIFCVGLLILLPIEIATGKEYFNSIFYSRRLGWAMAVSLIAYHLVRLGFFVTDNSYSDILRESIWS
ncbi:DUF2752 domain-containing protein [Flavobacterium selenitireducens]|uniref:DUF2752 domain-containing protein n=1 Tax=Flavobacterium selenitireducens TaxID=2722704 RepID=UPI001CC31F3C|nr:DUF2752 domain-containing protein [Flavobacterium selenitireducens]